jgi:hypothetical protein
LFISELFQKVAVPLTVADCSPNCSRYYYYLVTGRNEAIKELYCGCSFTLLVVKLIINHKTAGIMA